ncbi:unnamed protein product [Protopolystoma xenopodis]|uniref:TATA-binding protein interacting (TIP20) domain-containing protein n=1 Tax=Protopolystoma xenopodis TaxID=117903 RepID=A0A448WAG7_9PLAT|nr:unnamed protein product [Protopolystoma xenopodis]
MITAMKYLIIWADSGNSNSLGAGVGSIESDFATTSSSQTSKPILTQNNSPLATYGRLVAPNPEGLENLAPLPFQSNESCVGPESSSSSISFVSTGLSVELANVLTNSGSSVSHCDQFSKFAYDCPLATCLTRLADSDPGVQRAALVALNTAAHHIPARLAPLLTMSIPTICTSGDLTTDSSESISLCTLLFRETAVRQELIRKVEMGPFKLQVDDGLDMRKAFIF